MPSARDRYAPIAALGIIATVLIVGLCTYQDYGISWDESIHLSRGDALLDYYTGGHRDSQRIDVPYPGGFNLAGAVFRRSVPWMGRFQAIHLFGLLIGVLGLWGTWKLAREVSGPLSGACAVLLLALTPVYYGHQFNNPKDAPFATAYVWALWALMRWGRQLPRPDLRTWGLLALTTGLALGVRIAGLTLFAYGAALAISAAVFHHRKSDSTDTGAVIARMVATGAIAAAAAWLVMLAVWPWAWSAPLSRPFSALSTFTHFTSHSRDMPFAGEMIRPETVPWNYLLHYLGLKLPVFVLLLGAVGTVFLVRVAVRGSSGNTPSRTASVTLLFAMLLPPVYAAARGSHLYDGLRHFLFLVPVVTVVGGTGMTWLFRSIRAPLWRNATAGLIGLACVAQLWTMIALHPHQYVHFNRIAGGLPGAYGRYDTDYYGVAYKEAFEDLRAIAWKDPASYLQHVYRVAGCFGGYYLRDTLAPNFTKQTQSPDFLVAYTRRNCHESRGDVPILGTVERQGTPLIFIRDLRSNTPKAPAR